MGNKNSGATHTINLRSDRDEIIRDLVLKNRTKKKIAALCGIHESNVTRFEQKWIDEEQRREILASERMTRMEKATGVLAEERLDISKTYETLARRVERILTEAEATDQPAFALAAIDGLRKVLRDMAQMQGKLAQELTVNVSLAQAPEWVTLRNILSKVIDEVPAAREPLLRHMRHEALSITKEDQGIAL